MSLSASLAPVVRAPQFVAKQPARRANPGKEKLAAALALCDRGFAVFPLKPNSKEPAINNWQNLATTDPKQIRWWWDATPNANIGRTTGDVIVVDVDPRNGGVETFAQLEVIDEFPPTLVAQTQSGGQHYYYGLPPKTMVRGGTGKLGPGVDIKSWGGYVVAPGSMIDGRPYTWRHDRPMALAPQWLIDKCNAKRERAKNAGARLVEEDDKAVQLATDYVKNHAPIAQEGERDNTAYKVAARLYDFGVSPGTALELLTDWAENNTYYPPMRQEDIERVANSAGRNRDNPIGNRHPNTHGFEAVDISPPLNSSRAHPELAARGTPQVKDNFRILPFETFDEACDKALSDPTLPLVEGLLDCGAVAVMYGPPNAGKSFLAQRIAYAVATGRPFNGLAVERGAVVYVVAEGSRGARKRLRALRIKLPFDGDVPLVIVPTSVDLRTSDADVKALAHVADRVTARTELPVRLIVVDTLSRALAGGDENGKDMGALVGNLLRLSDMTGATSLAVHHPGKDAAKGMRGHSALEGNVDTTIEVEADKKVPGTPPSGKMIPRKQRDNEAGAPMPFKLLPVQVGIDTRGKPQRTLIAEIASPDRRGFVLKDLTPSEKKLMEAFDAVLRSRGDAFQETGVSTVEWDEEATKRWTATGIPVGGKSDTFRKHRKAVEDKGYVKKDQAGRWFLAPTEDRKTPEGA